MAINKVASLQKYVESRAGAPIIALCDSEVDMLSIACELASNEYWTALPYKSEYSLGASGGVSSEIIVSIDSLKFSAFGTNVIKDDAYFMGVLRYDASNHYNHSSLGSYNVFDRRLLGDKVSRNYHDNRDPRYLADRIQRASSEDDLISGELEFYHDIIKDELKILVPSFYGSAVLYIGWGISASKTTELVPFNHFGTYRKLVAFHFLEAVISARSAISVDSDYQVNTSYLEKVRDELKEEYKKELGDLAILPAVWG